MTNLNTHSHYTLLSGVSKIPDLIKIAEDKGYRSIALTDTNNMHGAIQFYKICKKKGIKPILGTTLSFNNSKLILLAKNHNGYRNILKVLVNVNLNKKNLDATMSKHNSDIFAIIPPFNNEIIKDENRADFYKEIYGENLYFGISKDQNLTNYSLPETLALAKKLSIKIVPSQLIYYMEKEDAPLRNVVLKIQNSSENEIEKEVFENADLHMQDIDKFEDTFKEYPEALKNLEHIVESVDIEIPLGNWLFPNVHYENPKKEFDNLIQVGLKNREIIENDEIKERLKREYDVIEQTGFINYFLAVYKIIEFMHSKDILTTTRGSAGGCLISYLFGITNVDPIKFNLPFERFLNVQRISAPDIDIDVPDNKRSEVIQWMKDYFGENSVAQIGTFGTMMARAAVRDTARALGYSYTLGDRVAKLIPPGKQGAPMYIDSALELVPDLRDVYNDIENTRYKTLIDTAKRIEGNVRHVSVHAAGVVVAPGDISDLCPLQFDNTDGNIITQFDMNAVEDVGLIKFDILGLSNLSILNDCIKRIEKKTGEKIDIENIPLDDVKTFELIKNGFTVGLFQLNGGMMTQFLKDLEPSKIEDINAMVALYRPGPMKNIPQYIRRKHGKEKIKYLHPKMEEFLGPSYGVLVYQDDIIFTALSIAGYTWKTVDALRKAIGKKIPEEMKKQESIFINGCIETSGMSEPEARRIWDLFVPFQGYGFNKAHAASYGKVAYQTSYMKANYTNEYMASILSSDAGDVEKVNLYYNECNKLKINILPPSVNESQGDFVTEGENSIRYGLYAIKNFGKNVSDAIVSEREKNGKYKNLSDFLLRIGKTGVINKRSVETLIKIGAFEEWEQLEVLEDNIEKILSFVKDAKAEDPTQVTLFGKVETSLELKATDKVIPKEQKLFWERELLGFYVSGHPLENIPSEYDTDTIEDLLNGNKKDVNVLCIINRISEIQTKNGPMAFIHIEDMTGKIEALCFNDVFTQYKTALVEKQPILIGGKGDRRDQEINFIINKVKLIEV